MANKLPKNTKIIYGMDVIEVNQESFVNVKLNPLYNYVKIRYNTVYEN